MAGIFPDQLKCSKVTPVYKKGDPHLIDNYSSITTASLLSKILEKAVYERLISFLNVNNLLANNQHGFRKGLSTETAAIELV